MSYDYFKSYRSVENFFLQIDAMDWFLDRPLFRIDENGQKVEVPPLSLLIPMDKIFVPTLTKEESQYFYDQLRNGYFYF